MLFTPGPTAVPPRVREAMSREPMNPDVDPEFVDFYERVTEKLATVYGSQSGGEATDHDVFIMGGEGILGLESAVASIVNEGDEVLCVSNGLYGDGFADFVESYGGDPVLVTGDYREGVDVERVEEAVAEHDFAAATMVHCETPTGTLNDLGPALDALDEETVSVVDAVSSFGGTPVPTDRIDVCLAASQKCLSAPPGLTTVAISERGWDAVDERDYEGLYTSFAPWKDVVEDGWFPYTHLVSDLYALDEALDRVLEAGVEETYEAHVAAAERCRERGAEIGLELFPGDESRSSPTVTAFHVPGRAQELQQRLHEDYDVLLATGLADLEDDVLRVGHMGYNADVEKVDRVMDALEEEV